MTPNVAKSLIVAKVLVADGMMTDDEHAFLAAVMTRLGLSDDERARVVELDGWDEAEAVVLALPRDDRQALLELLVDAAAADGRLSGHEHATLAQLTAALRLDA